MTLETKMFNVITKPISGIDVVSSRSDALRVLRPKTLSAVAVNYPEFDSWLNFTFLRGMPSGERTVLVAHCDGILSGISLLKNTKAEKKICTFFILPEFRGQGVGSDLMSKSLNYLGDDRINITVPEPRLGELKGLLDSSGFELVSEKFGFYLPDRFEFYFSTNQ
jgi:GNAT superfamily N-acetyltransferase